MTTSQKRSLALLIAFTVAGIALAAGVAPRFVGFERQILLATGMSLFVSGLTSFLIRFPAGRG